MATTLTTVSARTALRPRRNPYWQKLTTGCFVGFRKMTASSSGVWWARYIESGTNKMSHRSLGSFEELPANKRFDAAKAEAEAWFIHIGKGGMSTPKTIRDVCDHYVENIAEHRGQAAAIDARKRFDGYVLNIDSFAALELNKLTPAIVQAWRQRLAKMPLTHGVRGRTRAETIADQNKPAKLRTPSTLNRDITPFRAALNLAFRDGWVTSDFAWKSKLAPIVSADKQRDLYLDRDQRRRLIEHSGSDIAAFLRGLAALPLRPGALAALCVEDFDARINQLRIEQDKTGLRKITLPASTADFFRAQCAGKTPKAPLLARADGSAWNKDSWKGPIKHAVNAANLPNGATAYTLRHSVITDLVHGGLDLLTVAQLAGTSVRMIEKHYGHLRSEVALPALAALEL